MKKLLFILFILFNINVFSQTREFGKTYGDEPWKTFDKKNVGGKLITVGWGISVITFLSVNQPKPKSPTLKRVGLFILYKKKPEG